jgi:hypothetical protein
MSASSIQWIAAALFAVALLHTFAAGRIARLAHRFPRHAGLIHLLGEVEVVFGLWAIVLVIAMAAVGGDAAIEYVESREYSEPLFVFVAMVIAASRPVLGAVRSVVGAIARAAPVGTPVATAWLGLDVPERLKYLALGVLFVNVSIGGTLTAYAAPPVLMVATTWKWSSAFMLATFGWKAALAVLVNATVAVAMLRRHLAPAPAEDGAPRVPRALAAVHLALLAGVVLFAHHPVVFLGLFLVFLGVSQAYEQHQDPLILKEALLVGFFLAGLVVLGGMQRWWLQPIVSSLAPGALFAGALGLTAVTDNAALTYLGSLIAGLPDASKYMLMAGAVAGGGLTVIANAPNPAGVALLRRGFAGQAVGAGGLLLGAAGPTLVAAAAFLLL